MRLIDGDRAYGLIESRLDAVQFIKERTDLHGREAEFFENAINMALRIVETMPTIEQEEKVGEWIETKSQHFNCSRCGYGVGGIKSNYCPNCGWKTKGE